MSVNIDDDGFVLREAEERKFVSSDRKEKFRAQLPRKEKPLKSVSETAR